MHKLVCAAALAFGLVAVGGAAAQKKEKEAKGEVLKTVKSVTATLSKDKKSLVVDVVGEVPTGGWKDAKLTRRTYVKAPADGVYEYDLTAVKPDGIVTQVISEVKASDTWENPPAGLKGVKVYGVGDGAKTAKIENAK